MTNQSLNWQYFFPFSVVHKVTVTGVYIHWSIAFQKNLVSQVFGEKFLLYIWWITFSYSLKFLISSSSVGTGFYFSPVNFYTTRVKCMESKSTHSASLGRFLSSDTRVPERHISLWRELFHSFHQGWSLSTVLMRSQFQFPFSPRLTWLHLCLHSINTCTSRI